MSVSPSRLALVALVCLFAVPVSVRAQQRAALISAQQNAQTPYRYSGRLVVNHGGSAFFGTGTSIRRFTLLTAAHLLFDGPTGFSTDVVYQPDYYVGLVTGSTRAASFAVLSGYQSAATVDGDSDASFARDLGYILTVNHALNDEWADWQANPDPLLSAGPKLVLGYAADTFPGNIMAYVSTSAPYVQLLEGLYESTDYYTQEGMSGGPLYALIDGKWQVIAESVAGTSPPARAFSDVRAITSAERALLIDPEYVQGLIDSGFINGPATVAPGATGIYKTGVIFKDLAREGAGLPVRYSEIKLIAGGPNKKAVSIQFVKPGKYRVDFGDLQAGSTVELRLVRDTLPNNAQTPLRRYAVTVR